MKREIINELSKDIIGAAIEVHKGLGAGLLESAYEACLIYELTENGFRVEQQKEIPVIYKNIKINCSYRLDLMVEKTIIIEFKTVDKFLPIHTAQLLTYLKITDLPLGLLLNFNTFSLGKNGIKRVAHKMN